MNEFEITFFFNNKHYIADVKQVDNLYKVIPQDDDLKNVYGETVLLEANGDFAWQSHGPEHYRYVLSIANTLKSPDEL